MKNSPKKLAEDGDQAKTTSSTKGLHASQLFKLFEDELKDIYWAEKALTKAIPKMIKNATSEELIEALTTHLAETEEQVKRVEQVYHSDISVMTNSITH